MAEVQEDPRYTLWSREQYEVNTDPQRRCYYGCHFSSEWVWTRWNELYNLPSKEEAEESKKSWADLNKNTGRRLQYIVLPIGQNPNQHKEETVPQG